MNREIFPVAVLCQYSGAAVLVRCRSLLPSCSYISVFYWNCCLWAGSFTSSPHSLYYCQEVCDALSWYLLLLVSVRLLGNLIYRLPFRTSGKHTLLWTFFRTVLFPPTIFQWGPPNSWTSGFFVFQQVWAQAPAICQLQLTLSWEFLGGSGSLSTSLVWE